MFYKLSEADPLPAERMKWGEAVLEMAGWVTDIALFVERDEKGTEIAETWMVKEAIRRYYQALEELRSQRF